MAEKITAWSASRYSTYKQCPGKARILYILKLKEPSSPALDNGLRKHTDMEHYLKGYTDLPSHVNDRIHDFCKTLREAKPHAELQVAFNNAWKTVEWFSKAAWARIKIDYLQFDGKRVRIGDWKTGKIRDGEYDEQLELYALTGLLMFPAAEEVYTELVFIEQGVVLPPVTYTRDDLPRLMALWNDRTGIMLNDEVFEYTPNQYCGYCHFRIENGGPCTAA